MGTCIPATDLEVVQEWQHPPPPTTASLANATAPAALVTPLLLFPAQSPDQREIPKLLKLLIL